MTCISRDHIAGGTRGPSDFQQLSSKLWLITPAYHISASTKPNHLGIRLHTSSRAFAANIAKSALQG